MLIKELQKSTWKILNYQIHLSIIKGNILNVVKHKEKICEYLNYVKVN